MDRVVIVTVSVSRRTKWGLQDYPYISTSEGGPGGPGQMGVNELAYIRLTT